MNIYDTNGKLLYESDAKTLRGAVEEAVRKGVALTGANLAGAYLVGVSITGANLENANLTGAHLAWANLYKSQLTGANLAGANLAWANLIATTGIIDIGTDSRGWRWVAVQHDDGPRIAAWGHWFTLAEAYQHWDGGHRGGEDVAIECRSRLALLETLAKSKGWVK